MCSFCVCAPGTVEGQIIMGVMGVEVREEEPRYQKHDHQKSLQFNSKTPDYC